MKTVTYIHYFFLVIIAVYVVIDIEMNNIFFNSCLPSCKRITLTLFDRF